MKKYIKILFMLTIVAMVSCEDYKEYEPGMTESKELAGEWWIQFYDAETGDLLPYGYYHLFTSNTAKNVGSELLIHESSWYGTDIIVGSDAEKLTINALDVISIDGSFNFDIEGAVFKAGTKSPSGLTADSIYIKFTDKSATNPDNVIMAGYRHTGWDEDMH